MPVPWMEQGVRAACLAACAAGSRDWGAAPAGSQPLSPPHSPLLALRQRKGQANPQHRKSESVAPNSCPPPLCGGTPNSQGIAGDAPDMDGGRSTPPPCPARLPAGCSPHRETGTWRCQSPSCAGDDGEDKERGGAETRQGAGGPEPGRRRGAGTRGVFGEPPLPGAPKRGSGPRSPCARSVGSLLPAQMGTGRELEPLPRGFPTRPGLSQKTLSSPVPGDHGHGGGAAGLGGDVVTSPPLLPQSASKRRSAALELRGILVSSSVPKRGGGRGGVPFMG